MKKVTTPEKEKPPMHKAKAWSILCLTFLFLWFFGVYLGPWLQHHIYGMDAIVQVIEENDIDAGAYFYTEIKASYNGERYLSQSLSMTAPNQYGLTPSFLSGIIICLVILSIGWRYLPK